MKKLLFMFVFMFVFSILVFSIDNNELEKINDMVQKLKQGGVMDLQVTYDWGDGNKTNLSVENFLTNRESHFYTRPGIYDINVFLTGTKDGKDGKFPIYSSKFEYVEQNLKHDLEIDIPDEVKQGEKVILKADFNLYDNSIEIKADEDEPEKIINYQWFFDDEFSQFEQGNPAEHTFNIPNGNVKPYYTIKVRVFFKYKNANENNIWRPFESIKEKRIKVIADSKVDIVDYSKIMTLSNGLFETPFFITIKDNAYHNDREYYEKTNLFYRPIIYLGEKPHNMKLVDVKKVRTNSEKYNTIIYMIEFDKINTEILRTQKDGKIIEYMPVMIRINDPQGLYEKKMNVVVIRG
ncbi:MAG: hypothetical protein M0R46_17185 [Candidatus Muirbacterium halophilum]|nr:hypothetical protein [Candidatus Muirbacterium halophilum]